MKKSRVASNALNNPKAGYSQLARLEPTAFERRSRRLQLTVLEQLSKVLEATQETDPHTKKRTLPRLPGSPKTTGGATSHQLAKIDELIFGDGSSSL
jgi:hypothetical protein